jgi:glycosyltransferase involved in cell wall biosynthesis
VASVQTQATIIIPTFNHGMTLKYPLECLKKQTVENFEAFVIGDGVPEALKPSIKKLVSEDERFHFLDYPKHSRRGEPYRHEVLLNAKGNIVCYLCDRDLWLPDHLQQMVDLLSKADFAHSLPLHVLPDRKLRAFPVDVSFQGYRQMMLSLKDNRIPFSCFAHTLKSYHSLKEGWGSTPDGFWTDLYFFRKFFADEKLHGVSGLLPTAITFPTPPRKECMISERLSELEWYKNWLSTDIGRLSFEREILLASVHAQRAETVKFFTGLSKLLDEINNNTNPGMKLASQNGNQGGTP